MDRMRGMAHCLASALRGFWRQAGLSLAAVLGEIRQHRVHAVKLRAVNQIAPYPFLRDQLGVQQFFEVKRQRVGRHTQAFRQGAGRQARLARHYQGAENFQARGLSERGKGFNDGN